jgi:hypothetical protein
MKNNLLLLTALILTSISVKGQSFKSKHQFDNSGFYEEHIKVRLGYGKTANACDTLFIGKEVHYILACGDWHGWEAGHVFKSNESTDEGFALCHEVNPKNGRDAFKSAKKDWYWFLYLDDMCGKKLYRVTHVNYKLNQYISYLK